MVIFAIQNVITDPPFTRMDLISCRNLLIYLETGLQNRVIPAFHYALRPDGVLFLSPSEGIGNFTDLFAPVDKKWRIFTTKPSSASGHGHWWHSVLHGPAKGLNGSQTRLAATAE